MPSADVWPKKNPPGFRLAGCSAFSCVTRHAPKGIRSSSGFFGLFWRSLTPCFRWCFQDLFCGGKARQVGKNSRLPPQAVILARIHPRPGRPVDSDEVDRFQSAGEGIEQHGHGGAEDFVFRPLDHGVDISIHAATKYPAGHSDVLLGTVSANAACWPKLDAAFSALGLCAGPDDVYQVLRGLRTMGVRLEHHRKSALEIATWLEGQPAVARVLHPALASHPDHALWKRDFSGSSGVFSIVLAGGGQKQQHAFLDALTIFGLGYSWAGFESLAVPVFLGDRTVMKEKYEGPLIRLQIGLEDVEDLKADIAKGLAAIA